MGAAQREDGKRQAEVRAARAASIRVLRPLDGGREGRPEVDHAIHMIIDVGRAVGRSGEGEEAPSFLVQNTAAAVEWPAEVAANRRGRERGGRTGVSQRIMNIRIHRALPRLPAPHPLSHPAPLQHCLT